MPEYLTRPAAAEYLTARGLPITKNTLQKLACVGGGPIYYRFGIRTLYTRGELDAWAKSKLAPRRSTSEAA